MTQEAYVYRFLREYLPTLKNAVVIEAGANRGTDTRVMLNLLTPPFTYVAFEPDERCFPEWRTNVEQVQGLRESGADVRLEACALADVTGSATFWASSGKRSEDASEHIDSGSLMRPKNHLSRWPWISFSQGSTRTMRLDDYCRDNAIDRVDFMWVDVQGAELLLIAGARDILLRTRYFYAECYPNGVEYYEGQPTLKTILAALGPAWAVRVIGQTDVMFRRNE